MTRQSVKYFGVCRCWLPADTVPLTPPSEYIKLLTPFSPKLPTADSA